jgi:hypothetical protein
MCQYISPALYDSPQSPIMYKGRGFCRTLLVFFWSLRALYCAFSYWGEDCSAFIAFPFVLRRCRHREQYESQGHHQVLQTRQLRALQSQRHVELFVLQRRLHQESVGRVWYGLKAFVCRFVRNSPSPKSLSHAAPMCHFRIVTPPSLWSHTQSLKHARRRIVLPVHLAIRTRVKCAPSVTRPTRVLAVRFSVALF